MILPDHSPGWKGEVLCCWGSLGSQQGGGSALQTRVCVGGGGHRDLLKIELLATLVAESEFGHLPRKQTLRLGLSEGEASFPAPQPNHG